MKNVSVENSFVFIHVPKCGGTSISRAIFGERGIFDQKFHEAEHLNYSFYSNFLEQIGLSISSFFVFSFVRSPYSRIYSHWNFLRSCYRKRHSHHFLKIFDNHNLLYFLDDPNKFVDCVFMHRIEYSLGCRSKAHEYLANVFVPQVFWFDYDISKLNFLGKFENIENDFQQISERISCNSTLPHVNKTSFKEDEYLDFLNASSIEKINKMFYIDFKLLGYSFI
jgi:hypothetical protein